MGKVFRLNLSQLGISQLYISKEKLYNVSKWFDADKINEYAPLPVYDFGNGRYTLTDGHTRAYIMLKSGITDIKVQLDLDEMVTCDLGQRLYKTDVLWCEKYQMHGVSDFENRIVSAEEYSFLWIERCKRLQNLLVSDFRTEHICATYPDLLLYGANRDLSELYFDDCKGGLYFYKNGIMREETNIGK